MSVCVGGMCTKADTLDHLLSHSSVLDNSAHYRAHKILKIVLK